MPVIPTRELGAVGIIKDNSPTVIPPNAFSDGINVRFTEKKVSRAPIFRVFASTLTGTTPVWCLGLYNQGGYDSLIYANSDGRLFQLANGTETNVTEVGHVNSTDPGHTQAASCRAVPTSTGPMPCLVTSSQVVPRSPISRRGTSTGAPLLSAPTNPS
jgi:hypothetical protein